MFTKWPRLAVVVAAFAWICTAKSLNEPSITQNRTLWRPTNGTLENWIKCHGMPSDVCQRQRDKLQRLKQRLSGRIASNVTNLFAFDVTSEDAELATLDGCILLTEPQLDVILARLAATQRSSSESAAAAATRGVAAGGVAAPSGRRRKRRNLTNFVHSPGNKWTFPIPYKFDGLHNAGQQRLIRNAFQHWMDNTCARFTEIPLATSTTSNHILVTGLNSGCYSYVGKVSYIPQQLNLQDACLYRFGTPVHEIGHSLGLWHEQMRADRDATIEVLWNNIVPAYVSQFNNYADTDPLGVPYDLGSVMQYSSLDGVSVNGKDTMLALEPLYQRNMGQRTGLSFDDIRIINRAYCQNICQRPTDQPCTHGGYQDPNHCSQCLCPDGFSGPYCQLLAPSRNAVCGGAINLASDSQQTLISPGYDTQGYYMSYQECTWWLKAPPGQQVQLQFQGDFGLYCEFGACYHWVEVKYKADLALQGARFCCLKNPNVTITSATNEMMIIFKSNYSMDYFTVQRGFKALASTVVLSTRSSSSVPVTSTSTTASTSQQSSTAARTTSPFPPTTTPTSTTPTTRTTLTSTTLTTRTTPTSTPTSPTTATTTSTPTTRLASSSSGTTTSKPAPVLWQCSFEPGARDPLCGMVQDVNDQFDWTISSGPTPSDPTGPDSAYDQTYYLYIEASAPRLPNDEARIFFPTFEYYSEAACVDFYYHMFGFHINTLKLVQITMTGIKVIWTRSYDMGNQWYHANATVNIQPNTRLQFIASRGQEYSGDISIDKLTVFAGECK